MPLDQISSSDNSSSPMSQQQKYGCFLIPLYSPIEQSESEEFSSSMNSKEIFLILKKIPFNFRNQSRNAGTVKDQSPESFSCESENKDIILK